jgi:hypothetical protein
LAANAAGLPNASRPCNRILVECSETWRSSEGKLDVSKLVVKGVERREWGALRVRLHHSHRDSISRYGIAKITNVDNGQAAVAIILGHDDTENIFMDYDTREALGVKKGETLDFSIEKACLPRSLWWYLTIKDPLVRIPAWLAVWSIVLGVAGIALGLASMYGS